MTRAEIATMIAGIGLPYAYDHFTKDEAPGGPPFICFLYPNAADFFADDGNYQPITYLTLELYTDAPDFEKEAAVEAALTGAGLTWAKNGPAYIELERMYQTTWEVMVLLTEAAPTPPDGGQDNDTEVITDAE